MIYSTLNKIGSAILPEPKSTNPTFYDLEAATLHTIFFTTISVLTSPLYLAGSNYPDQFINKASDSAQKTVFVGSNLFGNFFSKRSLTIQQKIGSFFINKAPLASQITRNILAIWIISTQSSKFGIANELTAQICAGIALYTIGELELGQSVLVSSILGISSYVSPKVILPFTIFSWIRFGSKPTNYGLGLLALARGFPYSLIGLGFTNYIMKNVFTYIGESLSNSSPKNVITSKPSSKQ